MTKDFALGFLCGILFILILFMMSPPSPLEKRSKRQPVGKGAKIENLYDESEAV